MSPKISSEYPDKWTLRCSAEQFINIRALSFFWGMEGKYGPAIRYLLTLCLNIVISKFS